MKCALYIIISLLLAITLCYSILNNTWWAPLAIVFSATWAIAVLLEEGMKG